MTLAESQNRNGLFRVQKKFGSLPARRLITTPTVLYIYTGSSFKTVRPQMCQACSTHGGNEATANDKLCMYGNGFKEENML